MDTGQTPTPSGNAKRILSVDAMGGDKGPAPVIAGMADVAKKFDDVSFIVHGKKSDLSRMINKRKALRGRCEIRHCEDEVSMTDKPSHVMRHGKGTSMWSAVQSVKSGEANVCVSCGNTGALMALSMLTLRKIPGITRPAIAILWPSRNEFGFNVMLDVGADIKADAQDLLQYAFMGVSYARNGLDIARPRVGLLNVGTEDHKGRPELHEAFDLIEAYQSVANYDFVGFVEGGDIPGDRTDVIVTDGFTGNVALKTGEGTAKLIGELLREAFKYSPLSRLAQLLAITSLGRLKKRIDPRRVNGGVFLGLNGTVVKSHGSADATGVSAALKLALRLDQTQLTQKIAARVASIDTIHHDKAEE